MDTEVIEQPEVATSETDQYAEYVAARTAGTAPVIEEPASEIATETTEGSKTTQEEEKKPRRNSTAEGRIAELTAEKYRLEREMADWKKKAETTQAPAPVTSKPAEAKPANDGKPLLRDFVSALKADETYEDAQQQFAEAMAEYRDNQKETKAAGEREAAQRVERTKKVEEKLADSGKRIPTFFADLDKPWMPQEMKQAVGHFLEEADSLDALHFVATRPDEVSRIAALSPTRQLMELGIIQARLAPDSSTEKQKPPIASKAPPPLRSVAGGSPSAPQTLDTSDMAAYRRAREKK